MHTDRLPPGPPAPSLAAWGLSADADLLYRCLLLSGAQTAGQLERGLGMAWHRVARGLEELLSAGAVGHRPGDGRRAERWTPVAPHQATVALRARRHQFARPAYRPMRTGQLLPGQLSSGQLLSGQLLSGPVRLGDGMRHLPSRQLTRARLAELVRTVRHEHVAMQPERVYDEESARPAVRMDRALLAAGVHLRVLGSLPADAEDPLIAHGKRPDEPRPDYRQATERPMKLIVMDRRTALLPVSPDDLDRGYLEITDEAVVAALVALFERQWDAAARNRQEHPMPRIQLTAREWTLLGLLARGDTDESAARAMRISRRTVSNTLRDLMDRLGVDNRFQLGLAVGARRLLAPTTTEENR
jgi:DNA-binding CsgD family transcriptional regulator